jgi:protein-S-isoprenylcysteine O-methyltransferase Ste14
MTRIDGPGSPHETRKPRITVPRRVAIPAASVQWIILLPFFHGLIPWFVSSLTARHGWSHGQASPLNLAGLALVAGGTACLIWILFMHLAKTPTRVQLELTPRYLLNEGPYRFSRNPMFIAVLVLWHGWAIYYGSASVFAACGVLFLLVNFVTVPWEERSLEKRFGRFGESYRVYKRSVPRWIGRRRAPATSVAI